ncbi:cupin domain-containing protein [Falsiroseomonas stagni]|uniref:Cupin domain-containing protein n=1 Tax=Falsiroseomonas stagni DSM 19981 TaxID=1123062 RepID=A0A1I3Y4I4_9PROT|nr:hypothetical protein [Falsiroseomonas stagni]SFK26682.1 hypothetical protein SAMN02745775_101957 [Falsiroseomonas stagni DSM 19981]
MWLHRGKRQTNPARKGAVQPTRPVFPQPVKAGDPDGHHLRNHTDRDVLVLEIGTRIEGDGAVYPDIDMLSPAHGQPAMYTHRDGTPYPGLKRRGPEEAPGEE